MRILFVSNEGGRSRAGRTFTVLGGEARQATFTFEDLVRFESRDERSLSIDRDRLDQAVREIQGYPAVVAEESESVLLIYVLARRGLTVPRWLVHAADGFRRASSIRAWVRRRYGEDPLEILASERRVNIGYTTAGQRDYLLGLGLPPERTHAFRGCTAAQTCFFPDSVPAMDAGASAPLPPTLREVAGAPVAGGVNGRDLATLAEAAAHLRSPIHVITDLRRTPAPTTPWLVLHDVVPMADYIAALAHAGTLVVPLRAGPWSAGEQSISLAQRVGTPVVASAVPATAEYVQDGVTGFTAPPEDGPALAAAITRALAHRDDQALLERARARDAVDSAHFTAWLRRMLVDEA